MILDLSVESNYNKYNRIILFLLNIAVFSYLLLIFITNIHKVIGYSTLTGILCFVVFILLILWKRLSAFEYAAIAAIVCVILWDSVIHWSIPFTIEPVRFLMMSFCGIVIASGEFRPVLAKILLVSVISYFVYSIFILKIDPNEVLIASRNYISVNMLSYASIVYLTDYIKGKERPVIWPALAALTLSVAAVGRSGIIISSILFLVVIYINCIYYYNNHLLKNIKIKIYIILTVIGLIIFITILFYYLLPQLIKWLNGSRFNTYGMESVRFDLWKQFFSGLTLKKAVFGYDLNELPLLVQYKLNIHNSFLGIWAKIGMVAFPVFAVTLLTAWYLREKSYLLMIIFLLFLVRSSVDSVIFFKKYDFVLFSYMFAAFKNVKSDCAGVLQVFFLNLINRFRK